MNAKKRILKTMEDLYNILFVECGEAFGQLGTESRINGTDDDGDMKIFIIHAKFLKDVFDKEKGLKYIEEMRKAIGE
ncbi:MAG: hypothetical protein LBV03_04075 [Fusobacteriales bacterium]|nr:hypothetical protein [Fusobacteriales bacterium]